MRCADCENGIRRPERRAQVAERAGALVFGVPVEVCESCGVVWLDMATAKRLDQVFNQMLLSDLEVATRHFDAPQPDAA